MMRESHKKSKKPAAGPAELNEQQLSQVDGAATVDWGDGVKINERKPQSSPNPAGDGLLS